MVLVGALVVHRYILVVNLAYS